MLENWTSSKPLPEPKISLTFPSMSLKRAHDDQIHIGMQCFLKGMISKKWGKIQEEDYLRKHLPAKYNRIRWLKTTNHITPRTLNDSMERTVYNSAYSQRTHK